MHPLINISSLTLYLTLTSITVLQVSGSFEGCEENFVKEGCFKDKKRPLPVLLLNYRNQLKESWNDWENFIKRLACSCANVTRSKGFTYFGLQFFGECWSGVKPGIGYNHDGDANGCVGSNPMLPCEPKHPVCVGRAKMNFVYKLVTATPTRNPNCKDSNPACPEYANRGYCEDYQNVRTQCPFSCQKC